MRAGHIIPMQNAKQLQANTTYDLQQHPTDLAIAPAPVGDTGLIHGADGYFLNDDGTTLDVTGK